MSHERETDADRAARLRERLFTDIEKAKALLDELGYYEASVRAWHLDRGPDVTIFGSTAAMRALLVSKFGKPTLCAQGPRSVITAWAEWYPEGWHNITVTDWPCVVTVTEESVAP